MSNLPRKLAVSAVISVAILAVAAGTLMRGPVTTSAYWRYVLTQEDALSAFLAMGVNTNGFPTNTIYPIAFTNTVTMTGPSNLFVGTISNSTLTGNTTITGPITNNSPVTPWFFSNLVNGATFMISTNGHFKSVDQYGTVTMTGSNGVFSITSTNSSVPTVAISNGDLYIGWIKGLTTNFNVMSPGLKSNQMKFAGGILTNIITQ